MREGGKGRKVISKKETIMKLLYQLRTGLGEENSNDIEVSTAHQFAVFILANVECIKLRNDVYLHQVAVRAKERGHQAVVEEVKTQGMIV